MAPPPPTWGRVGVGDVSDNCPAPRHGFPLPTLSHAAGRSHLKEYAAFPPPPRWGRVGVGVVLSSEDRVELSRRRPHPNPPPPRGRGLQQVLRAPYAIALPHVGEGEISLRYACAIALHRPW